MRAQRSWRAARPGRRCFALAVSLIWWRGPDWHLVRDAFTVVRWPWVVAAVGLNLLSVVVRALAWNTVITQAIAAPRPRFRSVFSAFCVGLFANVVLPGRVGELARVAVLARRMPGRKGIWATLIGSVFAHRMFDLFPTVALVVWVLLDAKLPHWAVMSIVVVLAIGVALFAFAVVGARLRPSAARSTSSAGSGSLLVRARVGLARDARAAPRRDRRRRSSSAGWVCQLLAVWATMRAFHIYEPLVAAGPRAAADERRHDLPALARERRPRPGGDRRLARRSTASPTAAGFAFGIGLQAIEASVGVGIGTLFLAREGLSYASLK